MNAVMLGVRRSVAQLYQHDALHFLRRYRNLRPEDFDKAGRVKNFVDVLLAAECILKAHIFLGPSEGDAYSVYREVRVFSHNIQKLASRADFVEDRAVYDAIASRMEGLSVNLRYSLDMWETFFPTLGEDDATRRYGATVANQQWRADAVQEVQTLIEAVSPLVIEVAGGDIEDFFAHEQAMAEFVRQAGIVR